eukprot:scaffold38725_cov28-Tisochrysis_lutea.AAC.1
MGSSLPTEVHFLRYRVVEAFLHAGIPLERLRFLRKLIERNGVASLTDHSHMSSSYIPQIAAKELEVLRREVHDQRVSISFDGTTRLGEALCMTGRWCTSEFEIRQRLLSLATTKKHMDARLLAGLITQRLCNALSIDPHQICAMTRDSVDGRGAGP